MLVWEFFPRKNFLFSICLWSSFGSFLAPTSDFANIASAVSVRRKLQTQVHDCFRLNQNPLMPSWRTIVFNCGKMYWDGKSDHPNESYLLIDRPKISVIWICDGDIRWCFDYRWVNRATYFADAVYAVCRFIPTFSFISRWWAPCQRSAAAAKHLF